MRHYANGKLRREGRGLAYFYMPLSAGIAEIPLQENEATLAVTEQTKDFQTATVQGVVTYRFANPGPAASKLATLSCQTFTTVYRKVR